MCVQRLRRYFLLPLLKTRLGVPFDSINDSKRSSREGAADGPCIAGTETKLSLPSQIISHTHQFGCLNVADIGISPSLSRSVVCLSLVCLSFVSLGLFAPSLSLSLSLCNPLVLEYLLGRNGSLCLLDRDAICNGDT